METLLKEMKYEPGEDTDTTSQSLRAVQSIHHSEAKKRSRNLLRVAGSLLAACLMALSALLTLTSAESEAKNRPNIVFIYTDDMRYDELKKIPRFRSLLVARGVTFENAFVTNSVCCPSRVTALTGRYSSNHGVTNNLGGDGAGGYPAYKVRGLRKNNVAVWLRRANYKTALFGKFINGYSSDRPPDGFSYYKPTYSTASDPSIGTYAARFIEKNRKRPMFLAL